MLPDDPRLTAYLLGELSVEERSEVERELSRSESLRATMEELRAAHDLLSATFGDMIELGPPKGGTTNLETEPHKGGTTNAREEPPKGGTTNIGGTTNRDVLTDLQRQQIAAAAQRVALDSQEAIGDSRRSSTWRLLALAALVLYAAGMTWLAARQPATVARVEGKPSDIAPTQKPQSSDLDSVASGSGTAPIAPEIRAPTSDRPRNGEQPSRAAVSDDTLLPDVAPQPQNLESPVDLAMRPETPVAAQPMAVEEQVSELERVEAVRLQQVAQNANASNSLGFGGGEGGLAGGFGGQADRLEPLSEFAQSTDGIDQRAWFFGSNPQAQGRWDVDYENALQAGEPRISGEDFVDTDRYFLNHSRFGNMPGDAPTNTSRFRGIVVANPSVELEQKRREIVERNEIRAKNKAGEGASDDKSDQPAPTWKPATAESNASRLSVGQQDDLPLAARDVYVRIDGFRARVMLDCYYYSDRDQQLEGRFLLRLPDDASLHFLAFGPTNLQAPTPPPTNPDKPGVVSATNPTDQLLSQLRSEHASTQSADLARRAVDPLFTAEANSIFAAVKQARVVPAQTAALAYEETARRRIDPALAEWAGPGIFQTRVFPLVPKTMHRVIVGYDLSLRDSEGNWHFELMLPDDSVSGRVELDVAASAGTQVDVTPQCDPFISGNRAYYRYDRSTTTPTPKEPAKDEAKEDTAVPPKPDYQVTITPSAPFQLAGTDSSGDYFATRFPINLPEAAATFNTDRAIFLLDASWSERPEQFDRSLRLMETTLRQNRELIKQFAVIRFNVAQHAWRNSWVENNDANVEALMAEMRNTVLEGATDLNAALRYMNVPTWLCDEPSRNAPCFLLSDGAATWGATDYRSIENTLRTSDAKTATHPIFAYRLTGFPTDGSMLEHIANRSGGAVIPVADGEASTLERAAVAFLQRPWKLVKIEAPGTRDLLVGGGTDSIYPGQTLTVSGRSKPNGPLSLHCQRGEETTVFTWNPEKSIESPLVSRIYGLLALQQLETRGGNQPKLAVAYARHFAIPGRLCSLVMLDSQQDYERFQIRPEDDALVVKTSSVQSTIEQAERQTQASQESSKKQFIDWLRRAQQSPAGLFKHSTALELAIEQLPDDAFDLKTEPLQCKFWNRDQAGASYLAELANDKPALSAVMAEADRRLIEAGADDAVKVASTLIEIEPAEIETARLAVFAAMRWQRPDQAAAMLWKIAMARPYQPQTLLLLADCYAARKQLDAAAICYELAIQGPWNQRWQGASRIAELELWRLLQLQSKQSTPSSISAYLAARREQLVNQWGNGSLDLAVVIHWNTDRTDVDLHVVEPSGEECFYSHATTASGGAITQDITEGLGPEMFTLKKAPGGDYRVSAVYYRQDGQRTRSATTGLVRIYRQIGSETPEVETKWIELSGTGEHPVIATVHVPGK